MVPFKDLMILVFGISLLIIIVRYSFVIILVDGKSMLPTLCTGDRLLTIRHYPSRWLSKGNIVIAHAPQSDKSSSGLYHHNILVIKRITGLSGDIIVGHSLNAIQGYCHAEYPCVEQEKTWSIPEGYCFLQGDNLQESGDSRVWGPVPLSNIVGVVIMRLD